MLGGCGGGCKFCVAEQEAGGQQAQGGSLRAGLSGVPKRSKGRVRGLRRRWKALLCVLDFLLMVDEVLENWVGCTLGKKRG